jgi:pyridoxal phosphate enzyme (YggS family)
MSDLSTAFHETQRRISDAERRFGRHPGAVTLLAVSKTRTTGEIRALAADGQRHFGENYLQEALPKIEELSDLELVWHFIGKIQSNKTDAIAGHFDWVHTLDREKIAARLNDQRLDSQPPLNVCIQVNVSGETTKSGVRPEEVLALAKAVMGYPRLRLRGLMALPAPATDFDEQRLPFRRLARLLVELQDHGFPLDTLSLGTSDDFEAAIAEGATMVRIGTGVFGPRTSKY